MKKWIAALLFSLSLVYTAHSQSHVFRHYTTSDGLPSSETYSVIQDTKGYIWIATDRGLVKFDGYTFKVFTTNNGLPDNTVFELFHGTDNKIWFKTVSTAIGYIQNDSAYKYSYNNLVYSLSNPFILKHILLTNDGQLWFTHENDGTTILYEIDRNGKLNTSKNTTPDTVKRVYLNRRGEKTVTGKANARFVEFYLQESGKKIATYQSSEAKESLCVSRAKKEDSFFVLVNNDIVFISNGKCKKIINCNDREVLSIYGDKLSNVWVGYRDIGIERYSAQKNYQKDLSELNNYSISSICQDNEGGMWFTSLEHGVSYLPPQQLLSYTESDGLPAGKAIEIVKIEDDIAIHIANNTLFVSNIKTGLSITLPGNHNLPRDIKYEKPGKLYIVNSSPNIEKHFKNYKSIPLENSKKIHVGYNFVWTLSHFNIAKYNKNGKLLHAWEIKDFGKPMCLYEKKNGDLLIGTVNGLYLYKHDSVYSYKTVHPLLNCRISDIQPINNNLVISSIGCGILIIKGGDFSHPVQYTEADGLPSMMCNMVLPDSGNVVWVGTNRGLCRMTLAAEKKNTLFKKIDINDGLVSNEINDIEFVNNTLWLATAKGVSIVPRDIATQGLPDIPMYIDKISVNGTEKKGMLPVEFSYNQNNISIFFTGLHYRHAGKLEYRYRMSGDTNWYYTTNRSVVFNSLQPGKYTFEVSIIKPDGQINPKQLSYSFVIYPPFWQTWWFVLVSAVFIIVLTALIIYRLIVSKKMEAYKKAQLDRKLAQLELEAIKAQINPHFIYNCLNSIQYFNYINDYSSVKKYFSTLARLIRQTMQFSHEVYITIEEETNYLSNYLELEKIRYKNKLEYSLTVSPGVAKNTLLPSMLVQPYVENALKHGISNIDGTGHVWISFSKPENGGLLITIEDNGPGMMKKNTGGENINFGTWLTGGRVTSYNQLFGLGITINSIDKASINPASHGLKIEILIPSISTESMDRKKLNSM